MPIRCVQEQSGGRNEKISFWFYGVNFCTNRNGNSLREREREAGDAGAFERGDRGFF